MRFVKTLVLGITLAAAAPGLHAQAQPASGAGAKPAAKPAAQAGQPAAKSATQAPAKPAAASSSPAQNKPATPATNKPAASAAKPAAPKMQAGKPAKSAQKHAAKKSTPRAAKPAASGARSASVLDKETRIAKRDPFESLIGREVGGGPKGPFPPGKAGLQVSTLRLDGIVRAPNGMIAVVSNPQSRTYFLREGDQLYDGRV